MYNLILSVKKLNVVVRIIIAIVLLFFSCFIPFFSLFFIFFMILEHKTPQTNPEKYKNEILEFQSDYDRLRRSIKGSVGSEIYIGDCKWEYNGKINLLSRHISVFSKDVPDGILKVYPDIKKQIDEFGVYYYFPKFKRYSKTAKITIILSVMKYISETYPDDKLRFDKSIPIGVSLIG